MEGMCPAWILGRQDWQLRGARAESWATSGSTARAEVSKPVTWGKVGMTPLGPLLNGAVTGPRSNWAVANFTEGLVISESVAETMVSESATWP